MFSRPVLSNSLWPHGLQHTRLSCLSPSPKVFPSSCSFHQWCHPAISPLLPSIFPATGTFPISQLFTSDDWNTGASASVLPTCIQGLFPWRLVWSPCCPRDFQESSPALQFEGINSLVLYLLYSPALTIICDHREDHSLDYIELCQQSNVSAFSTLSSFVIAFLPRSNCLLISWLQSSPTVILEPKKRKSVTTSTFPPSICHDLSFKNI